MNRIVRAAGFAAALLVALFGAFYAGPSRAWEMTTAPLTSISFDHQAALIDGGDLSLNALGAGRGDEAAAPAPITNHAAAPSPAVPDEAETPVRRSLAELVDHHSSSVTRNAEHECLAGAVYFESKGEPLAGQLTVAEVVLNRARSGRFPASVCGVVKQKGQFSFIRGGGFPPIARSTAAWRKAVAVAHVALEDLADGHAPKALFFHARYVKPAWRGLTRIASVGNHIFYR